MHHNAATCDAGGFKVSSNPRQEAHTCTHMPKQLWSLKIWTMRSVHLFESGELIPLGLWAPSRERDVHAYSQAANAALCKERFEVEWLS